MATRKIGLYIWLGLVTVLWSQFPLLFSSTRGVLLLGIGSGVLTCLGWLTSLQLLVVWGGGLGLVNLTLALWLASHPPRLWVGLSAGILLLALLDTTQRAGYLRRCHLTPGVITALFTPFVRLSALSLVAGTGLGVLVAFLSGHPGRTPGTGLLTVVGACLFVGFVALFLLSTSHVREDYEKSG